MQVRKRVVITGMGTINPLGNHVSTFWENIVHGKCGVTPIQGFDTRDYKVKVAGEVKDFHPEDYMDRRETRRMDRYSQFAIAAATQAVEDAGLILEEINGERFGVVVGSGVGGIGTLEQEHKKLLEKGPNRVSPLLIPMIITNMAAGNIAIRFGAKGICTNVVTACATGTHTIGDAYRLLQHGEADIIIAGGAEASITPVSIAGFTSLTALSTNPDPLTASRPFDAHRDGFVMGEGAGIVILETLEHAQHRKAKIFGEIVGYGATCDAYHMTSPAPEGEGAARAMELAIQEAGIVPEQVSYINAHGTSTSYNDAFETAAIKKVFGKYAYQLPISSTKSMTGHLLGAAGAVEAIVCIKALEEGFVPATIGYETPDPDCDLDYVPQQGRKAKLSYALSNSLGFGGHNGTLVFKKWME
mgnify:CR=1 FL=1